MTGQDNIAKSASRVSLDHFDPEGVQQLSRTLSQSSAQAKGSLRSDSTLAPNKESFSLEKILRAALDKYACLIFYNLTFRRIPDDRTRLTTLIDNMIPKSKGGSSAYTSRIFASLVSAPQSLIKQRLDQ